MKTEQAIEFLKNYQPMPSKQDLTEDRITRFDEVRQHLTQNPIMCEVTPMSSGGIPHSSVARLYTDAIGSH